MGRIRGTPRMRSHISVHGPTTKYFSNSFVFKTEIEKEGLPGDITPALGAGGPEFKSRRPDHFMFCFFYHLASSQRVAVCTDSVFSNQVGYFRAPVTQPQLTQIIDL